MDTNKPVILYTRAKDPASMPGYSKAYQKAIEEAGGEFKIITEGLGDDELKTLAQTVDGIYIPGGADIDPAYYRQAVIFSEGMDKNRDHTEMILIQAAVEKQIPILGICKGIQIMNVALGGDLYQDVHKENPNFVGHDNHKDDKGNDLPRNFLAHKVMVGKNSTLNNILGTEHIETNSLHHQGVKQLGKGLVASARSADGLIEAIELPGHPYFVAVQWHPEELTDNPIWKNFFTSFIQAAKLKQS